MSGTHCGPHSNRQSPAVSLVELQGLTSASPEHLQRTLPSDNCILQPRTVVGSSNTHARLTPIFRRGWYRYRCKCRRFGEPSPLYALVRAVLFACAHMCTRIGGCYCMPAAWDSRKRLCRSACKSKPAALSLENLPPAPQVYIFKLFLHRYFVFVSCLPF
jgi:hypothetical protein